MATLSTGALQYDMVIYVEEQTSGTDGGDFTLGDWRVRTLNTTRYSRQTGSVWASLASNQITLQAGSYYIEASAPAVGVSRNITQFYNDTDGTTEFTGTAEYCESSDLTQIRSFIEGVVTITAQKVFELQHECNASNAGDGMGIASNIITNTYSMIKITRLTPIMSTRSLQYDMVIYTEEQTSGVDGGDFNSGGWETRLLNTERYSRQTGSDWASLATNQIELQPGSYLIEASAPALDVNRHITQFFNDTDATTEITGTAEFSREVGDHTVTRSFILGVVVVSGSAKTFELQHQCQTTQASDGFGVASNIITNTYAMIRITKLS